MTTRPTAREQEQLKGSDSIRDARQDPVAQLRRRQADLAAQIREWTRDNLPAEDVEGLIERHVEETRTAANGSAHKGAKTVAAMFAEFTELRKPVICNLARVGETVNIVAPSKRGKSWLVLLLALCVATGKRFLGNFGCVPGRVLLIDNELHAETSTFRVRQVASALALKVEEYGEQLLIDNVRGRNLDIDGLAKYLLQFDPGHFAVIILDALYRFLPKGCDENANADMTAIYNKLDALALRLQCAFICIVHSSKGSQADKSVVDVGSGAGAQARACDSHCILRQHEEPDAVVLDLAPRSYPPLDSPICLRFKWPLWTVDGNLDPALLHRPGKKAKAETEAPEKWTAERFAKTFGKPEPQTKAALIEAATAADLSERAASSLIKRAASIGKLHKWPTDDKREFAYATVPAPVVELPKAVKSQRKRSGRKAG